MRALALVAAAGIASGAAAATPEEARRMLEERFPVEVLRLEPAEAEGRTVYIATVMVRPGDYNDAMQVVRLAVDAETGALVPRQRTTADTR